MKTTTYIQSLQVLPKARATISRAWFQTVGVALLAFPLVTFGQMSLEGHEMQTPSWIHWVATIALVGAIGWIAVIVIKRRRNGKR